MTPRAQIRMSGARSERCDIAVVGAGPAGATAACHLARAGLDVALIDRAAFPRDKVCGDLLGADALEELAQLGVDPAEAWPGRTGTARRWREEGQDGTVKEGEEDFGAGRRTVYFVRRADFDDTLRRLAVSAGARWLSPCRVTGLRHDPLGRRCTLDAVAEPGRATRIEASAVICATGAGKGVAGTRFDATDDRIYVAGRAHYENVALPPDTYDFYHLGHGPAHYGWAFPLPGARANVGIIMPLRTWRLQGLRGAQLVERLPAQRRLPRETLRAAVRVTPFRAVLLRTGLQPGELCRDGMILVGDAAGMADPRNGEGIGPAMFSGHAAADALREAWQGRSPLRHELLGYEAAVRRKYGEAFEITRRRFAGDPPRVG